MVADQPTSFLDEHPDSFQSFIGKTLAESTLSEAARSKDSPMPIPTLTPLSVNQLNAIAPIALAYIGDAVFELYVRSRFLFPAQRIHNYHQQVVAQVKAEQQANHLDSLVPYLTEAEKNILRRGRNATSGRQRRADAQTYQKSTGFEALIGFLYLSNQPRLFDLLNRLKLDCPSLDGPSSQ
ncbi:MAG: Mini-ribonuclease 3 [Phormidesmis sp. RL_2_1]|nr:Mini-ribonuclease 3 [Phormidesmis sp. RL_2_1]